MSLPLTAFASIEGEWSTGYALSIDVINPSKTAVSSFLVSLDLPQGNHLITSISGADCYSQSGSNVIIESGPLAAGGRNFICCLVSTDNNIPDPTNVVATGIVSEKMATPSEYIYVVQYHNIEYYKFYEIGNVTAYKTLESAHNDAVQFVYDHNVDLENPDGPERYDLQQTDLPTDDDFGSSDRCYYVFSQPQHCALWIQRTKLFS